MFVRDSFEHHPFGVCSVAAGQDTGGGGGTENGASSNGVAAPAGREAGGEGANGHEPASPAPVTLDAFKALLDERDRANEKRFKRLNDELASHRRGTKAGTAGEEQGQRQEPPTGGKSDAAPRDERRVDRELNRLLGELEASGLDAEQLERIETATDSMSLQERAIYTRALREGMRLGGKKPPGESVTGDREIGTGNTKPQGARGRAEAPATRSPGVALPGSWEEYADLPKSEAGRVRKAALDKLAAEGRFDPVQLRADWEAQRRGAPIIRKAST